jgi:hypothetical protein
MVLTFALIGAAVAIIPGASFLLIPMEVYLLYRIMMKYNAFDWMPFLGTAGAICAISATLKGLALFLSWIPLANSVVAFGFIFAIGTLADQHYSGFHRKQK